MGEKTRGENLVQLFKDGPRDGPSMGCQVARHECYICGEVQEPCEHLAGIYSPELSDDFLELPGDVHGPVRLISVGTVPAPTCESCDESMTYTGEGTDWVCRMPFCDQEGIVVTTGVGGLLERAHRAT
jgi:hypothetical protein